MQMHHPETQKGPQAMRQKCAVSGPEPMIGAGSGTEPDKRSSDLKLNLIKLVRLQTGTRLTTDIGARSSTNKGLNSVTDTGASLVTDIGTRSADDTGAR